MPESPSPLEIVARAQREFRAWLDILADAADPSAQRMCAIDRISQMLREVDRAVQLAPPEMRAGEQWRTAIATYTDTLQQLRAKLGNLEIALRIRSSQIASARARASAVDAWANLARHVG
jgi:hypothetical protein